jgi:hypothetical protein
MENVNAAPKPWYRKWWVILIAVLVVGYAINRKGQKSVKAKAPQEAVQEKKIHRCGRTWNGQTHTFYGQYGDYCSGRCYEELYPN